MVDKKNIRVPLRWSRRHVPTEEDMERRIVFLLRQAEYYAKYRDWKDWTVEVVLRWHPSE